MSTLHAIPPAIGPATRPAYASALDVVIHAHLPAERLAHTIAVGHRAGELARRVTDSPADARVLSTAGTLHDIGYAYPDTGHHGIDGARWLRDQGLPGEICALVAHHSTAAYEARDLDLLAALDEFETPPPFMRAVIWAADFTTGPRGDLVSVATRLDEIHARHGADSATARTISTALPQMRSLLAVHLPDIAVPDTAPALSGLSRHTSAPDTDLP